MNLYEFAQILHEFAKIKYTLNLIFLKFAKIEWHKNKLQHKCLKHKLCSFKKKLSLSFDGDKAYGKFFMSNLTKNIDKTPTLVLKSLI